jgi:hypothetical protein
VTILPDAAALLVNEAITAAVAVRDSDGVVQPARAVVWRSLDPAVATVDDAGTLTGRSPGRTGVVAAVDSAADTLSVIVRRISRMTIIQTGATTPSAVDTMTFALVALDQSGAVIDGQSAEWTIVGTGILLARAGAGTRVVQHGSTPFVLTASVLNDEATLTVQPPGGSSLPPVPQPPASQPPAHRDER